MSYLYLLTPLVVIFALFLVRIYKPKPKRKLTLNGLQFSNALRTKYGTTLAEANRPFLDL